MSLGMFTVPPPENEPVRAYLPGSSERRQLERELARQAGETIEVSPRIGGRAVRTGRTCPIVMPHDHAHVLGHYHRASLHEAQAAIAAAEAARPAWAALPFEERAAIFLRAATLVQDRFRDQLNASTMLGQSKTVHQAEIDAACETKDFFVFNAHFLQQMYREQPRSSTGTWNRVEYRPLDGFVFAITPFNFTSIAANLPTAPALCGNTVVWKPASSAVLSAHYIMELLEAAGLPPGVVNFLPGAASEVADPVLDHTALAGVHFTGSTDVFRALWKRVASNLERYGQYPRLVGETGGKDFVFAHASADVDSLVTALLRGAFEYQGQKCSAVSRAYLPDSLWPRVRATLADSLPSMKVGDPRDFRNFLGAVIDRASFQKLSSAIDDARKHVGGDVIEVLGGECDADRGWFVRPTVVVTRNPHYRAMCEELFGPILTIYVYPAAQYQDTLQLCDHTSRYALTGAIFADDRHAIAQATSLLRHAAGNFYVNDKPTGAVVGQQPFGGSRASGTNDKAGSMWNLMRWVSPRTIKENFDPPRGYRYPFMDAE